MFTQPEPTGQYAVGTIARELTDEQRDETLSAEEGGKRKLMVNVWYPADPDQTEGKPKEHYPQHWAKRSALYSDCRSSYSAM